jgi:predicted transport protein
MLKVDPSTVQLEPGFSRDVTSIGHWGTGDLELTLQSLADLERAKPLIERSYREH